MNILSKTENPFLGRAMLRVWIGLLSLFLFLVLTSQHTEANGWAWSVTKGRHVSYIAGSVHLANESFYPIDEAIMQAFQSASVLYVEMDDSLVPPAEQASIIERYAYLPDGKSLSDLYSDNLVDQIDLALQDLGATIDPFLRLRPTFIAMNISVLQAQKLGYTPLQGIDRYFLNAARQTKIVRQIETFEGQMRLLTELPSDEASLLDAFSDMSDYQEMWKLVDRAWKNSDADLIYQAAIVDALNEFPELATLYDKLFFERNVGMADAVERCLLREEVCFVIVGGGHLPGDKGVVDLLQKRGYELKAIH